jgi:hypothetical protein
MASGIDVKILNEQTCSHLVYLDRENLVKDVVLKKFFSFYLMLILCLML